MIRDRQRIYVGMVVRYHGKLATILAINTYHSETLEQPAGDVWIAREGMSDARIKLRVFLKTAQIPKPGFNLPPAARDILKKRSRKRRRKRRRRSVP